MGYRVIDVDGTERVPDRPCTLRRLSQPAGLENVAINRFEADPGEQLPLAYHYHDEQEEAFYVLEGTLFVETPEDTYEVPEDHLLAVDPESPQRAYNPEDADEHLSVLAIGAPAVEDDVHAYDPEE
jgi:mannose-6-phosphate isomerase-like protein (cupin superfamily)